MIFDTRGCDLHRTPSLSALFSCDPAAEEVVAAARAAEHSFTSWSVSAANRLPSPTREARAATAGYTIRLCTYGSGAAAPGLIVAAICRETPARRTAGELRAAHGITPA